MKEKYYVHDFRNYKRDPNVYVKNEEIPWGSYGSEVWPIWYFKSIGRGRTRYYESYGMTEEMAKSALEKAIHKKVEAVSKNVWRRNKGNN